MPAKIKVKFSKSKAMVYISHLDLMRLFQRALRRAQLPVALTQGFNPHAKISIYPAVKLGKESADLKADIYLSEQVEKENFKNKLQAQLPKGIEILEIEEQNG